MTQNQREIIAKDRMKYKSNALSSNLSLLAIVFNACYFITVFKINVIAMYTYLLGISVVFNLLFMLTVFLASTKLKAYDRVFCYVLFGVAVLQVIRIFIIPAFALENGVLNMDDPDQAKKYTWLLVWLLSSSASLILAGLSGILRSLKRSRFIKSVESGEVDISFISKQQEV